MDVEQHALKVLIAEDSAPDRLILATIVSNAGHIAIPVTDGVEAVTAFKAERPDIILMDVLMPNMGGVEAAKKIREIARDELVPILFLTSLSDTDSLVECLEAGGDDFVSKPYNRVVLQSKIKAFGRMREMHTTVAKQRDEIERHHNHLIQEQRVAKQVFDKIAHSGCLDLSNIRYSMSPLAVFNGDVLVAEVSPSGNMIILLGDFTGHGLPAAVGSIPLATTFYGMVRKGFALPDILREINHKLHEILPVGFFCCATCIELNFAEQTMFTWTGGLPPSYLYRYKTDSYDIINSSNLPLGVLASSTFKAEPTRIELDIGDRLYMWSDGVFESRNAEGDMFGEDRLHDLMQELRGKNTLFDTILGRVHQHIGANDKDDDISLVEIIIQNIEVVPENTDAILSQSGMQDWSMDLTLSESSLKEFDPLPLLINIVTQVPGLQKNSTFLYTMLAELYANALEHGVLALKSADKHDPRGFTQFYQERKERLAALEHGSVKFEFKHEASEDGGLLIVVVKDSGEGFDVEAREQRKREEAKTRDSKTVYHGRGLTLLSSISEKLIIHPPGNHIEVHFRWKATV
ncbi:SpoIIE family protein phosphatase [Saccharophagus degradans]|uniref:Stage II sporulation E n=1 Tax=Saccharophagus degradans (strain 2-40 / ATCC 43961 / DSM 17024) TaxID=203122 RepID=Q21IP0_SACD2|nr:SpoIIE family protein phosphatase [Saccharophagus degradans]ABD81439.1 Stage II sporulation E [Saccharophagus degradans 2-40]